MQRWLVADCTSAHRRPRRPASLLIAFLSVRPFASTPRCEVKKRMPPKKTVEKEKKAVLGRPSNNLKIGIVGLLIIPSCSLSTQIIDFSAVHRAAQRRKIFVFQCTVEHRFYVDCFQVEKKTDPATFHLDLGKAANFPYATIDPEEARIPVPDPRFDWLCEVYKPASKVPAFLTCIDIAGLTAVSLSDLY